MNRHDPNQRIADLHKVLEISRSMVAATDLASLLRVIIDRGMELLGAERATLFLYDPEANELVSRVAAGVEELRIPADRGISGATIRGGRTLNVPDVYADERFNPEIDRTTGFRTRSLLSVPLFGHDARLVGVLQVINKRDGAFDDYDVTLAETLGAQAGVAIQREDLLAHYLRKQQMERAMNIARDIQRGLLPKTAPRLAGFDIAGFSLPAEETGGDTYDFFELPDGRWVLSVADASGHGIGSALVIAETRALLRAVALRGGEAGEVLRAVNDLLGADLGDERFVTCFCGFLHAAQSVLTYASAGHGPLIFYQRSSDQFQQLPATSLPLGVARPEEDSQTVRHPLAAGDFAVISTDGFMDTTNPAGLEFGTARVIELLRRHRDDSAEGMIRALHAAVCDFAAGASQVDDLTAVVVKRL
jgi:phosphoserine phosphatase